MDAYAILGLSTGASRTEVRRAYYKLALTAHPDKGGDVDSFHRVLDAYAKLEAELRETVCNLCIQKGYECHTSGDLACAPEQMDWVIGDSTIRTSKSKGVSHIHSELFEKWHQTPNRGSAITMVCCDGKELRSITDVLARIPAMNNLLVVWQGNEYNGSFKKMQFGQYREDLAGTMQTLKGHMSRARDARLVALAPDSVWEYGQEFANFERCAWPLLLEQFGDSTALLSRGERFANLKPFVRSHVAAARKGELAELILHYLLGVPLLQSPSQSLPHHISDEEHFEMLDRSKKAKLADLIGNAGQLEVLIAALGQSSWPQSIENASVEFFDLLKKMLNVTKSKTTKNVANKETGWNRFLGLEENWKLLLDALISADSPRHAGDDSEPAAHWEETPSEGSTASTETNPWRHMTAEACAETETNPWRHMNAEACAPHWADVEDSCCRECSLLVPWVFVGRGSFKNHLYCKDCWSAWRWNEIY